MHNQKINLWFTGPEILAEKRDTRKIRAETFKVFRNKGFRYRSSRMLDWMLLKETWQFNNNSN